MYIIHLSDLRRVQSVPESPATPVQTVSDISDEGQTPHFCTL